MAATIAELFAGRTETIGSRARAEICYAVFDAADENEVRTLALATFAYAIVACLILNDALKVGMIRWRVPSAVGGKPRGAPAPSRG